MYYIYVYIYGRCYTFVDFLYMHTLPMYSRLLNRSVILFSVKKTLNLLKSG